MHFCVIHFLCDLLVIHVFCDHRALQRLFILMNYVIFYLDTSLYYTNASLTNPYPSESRRLIIKFSFSV